MPAQLIDARASFARDILADMQAAYLADDWPREPGRPRPRISAGKDSTALAQFLYYMLARRTDRELCPDPHYAHRTTGWSNQTRPRALMDALQDLAARRGHAGGHW